MLARAAEAPFTAKVLEYCRLVELLLMMRDSERDNDFQMYMFANAIALGYVFAVTNCFNYVRCICERLLRWFVASPADMIIYTQLTFSMLTRWGKRILCDRLFEHVQTMIRAGCGRAWNPHNHKKIVRIASDVPAFAESRTRNVRSAEREMRADGGPGRLFWHGPWLAAAPAAPADGGLWIASVAFRRKHHVAGGFDARGSPTGLGAPVLVCNRKSGKMEALGPHEHTSLHVRGEKPSAEGLCGFVIGPTRASAYTDRWCGTSARGTPSAARKSAQSSAPSTSTTRRCSSCWRSATSELSPPRATPS
jgi:hypothetical protein